MGQTEINSEYNPIVTRIRDTDKLDDEKKRQLLGLIHNSGSYDERVMKYPVATIKLMVSMGAEKILEESIPQVEEWTKANEPVSMLRILEYLLEKYLDE